MYVLAGQRVYEGILKNLETRSEDVEETDNLKGVEWGHRQVFLQVRVCVEGWKKKVVDLDSACREWGKTVSICGDTFAI